MTPWDFFTVVLVVAGVFFFFAGTVGLLRFPDVFTRLHALTKVDNLGLGLIIIGMLPQLDTGFAQVQLVLIWVLVMASGAVCCYLVANRAMPGEPPSDRRHPDD